MMIPAMDSRRMKKMVWNVVRVPKMKHVSKSADERLLITADQPLSDANGNPIIPKGFVAVYVGPNHRRFLVPTRFLSAPDFRAIMDKVAEEFGYEQEGGLTIPCDEDDFQKLLAACKIKSKSKSNSSFASYYTNS